MAPRHVLIGTPTHDFRVDARYASSLTATHRLCMEKGIVLREIFLAGDAIIQNARNDLVQIALDKQYDDLVFIDSDQDWEAESFVRLLSYPVDCVGAAIRKKADDQELYNVKTGHGPWGFFTGPHGLMTAPDMTLGTGFLRLSRKALQVLWDNSEE